MIYLLHCNCLSRYSFCEVYLINLIFPIMLSYPFSCGLVIGIASWYDVDIQVAVWNQLATEEDHAIWNLRLRALDCRVGEFESRRGFGRLCLLSVVLCQVEVSTTGRSLVQRSRTLCECVIVCLQVKQEHSAPKMSSKEVTYEENVTNFFDRNHSDVFCNNTVIYPIK